jgi:hypothetical protein
MDPSTGSTKQHRDSDLAANGSNLRSFRWRVQLGLLPTANDSVSQWPALLAQQREDYQRLIEQHPFPDDDEQPGNSMNDGSPIPTTESAASQFDPLTAMLMEEQEKSERLQELDLKYRREKALRKRGYGNNNKVMEDEEYDEQAAALQIIDKDLDRLPSPHTKRAVEAASLSSPSSSSPLSSNQHDHYQNNNNMMDDTMVDVVLDDDDDDDDDKHGQLKRRAVLRQVLFVYTCEHPDSGYRQGMHEIASYLLHALQLDQDALEKGGFNKDKYDEIANSLTATTADLSADTYTLLVHILTAILPAYDVGPTPQSQPLPAMSRRILNIIQEHCPELHYTLTELDTPPQLYLTKWIRLLYSREVTQVLELWDELFFPSVSVNVAVGANITNTKYHHQHTWMEVLECTAAARLLLRRQPILQSPDASHRLHLLMNLPVQADIAPLVQLTKQLLEYPVRRSVVVLPSEIIVSDVQVVPVGTATKPATTSSTGLHPLQEHSTTPTDQGHHQFANASQHEGDLGAAASALANRFSLSAVKQSLEQAKTQTESIKKRLYQEWGSLAVATNNSDQQQYQSNNTGSTQQQQHQQNSNNYSDFNPSSSARKPNVTGDPSRRNYDDPLLGGIDWSCGGQSHPLSSSPGASAELRPQLNGERQTPHASNESPSRVSPRVQHGHQHQSQTWAQSIQASSMVLQDFVMAMEKQSAEHGGNNSNAKVVPAAVWEALADLEVLRRDMLSSSGA